MSSTTTISQTLTLTGFDTTTDVKGATLEKYYHSTTSLKFGATANYARGYAVRAAWPNGTIRDYRADQIDSMTIAVNVSNMGNNVTTRYGALASDTGATITSASASTTTVTKNTNWSTTIAKANVATFRNSYGIGFGGTVSSTSTGDISSITVTITVYTYVVYYKKGSYGTGTDTYSPAKKYGESVSLAPKIFTRVGYEQDGWSLVDGGAKSYDLGQSITLTSDVTVYPHWKSLNTIRIVNGSALDTYLVYIVENSTLVPYRVTVVNSAGTGLDIYT